MSTDKPKEEQKETSAEEPKEEVKEEVKPEILFKYEFLPQTVYNLLGYIRSKEAELGVLIGIRDALSQATNIEEIKAWEEKKRKEKADKEVKPDETSKA